MLVFYWITALLMGISSVSAGYAREADGYEAHVARLRRTYAKRAAAAIGGTNAEAMEARRARRALQPRGSPVTRRDLEQPETVYAKREGSQPAQE